MAGSGRSVTRRLLTFAGLMIALMLAIAVTALVGSRQSMHLSTTLLATVQPMSDLNEEARREAGVAAAALDDSVSAFEQGPGTPPDLDPDVEAALRRSYEETAGEVDAHLAELERLLSAAEPGFAARVAAPLTRQQTAFGRWRAWAQDALGTAAAGGSTEIDAVAGERLRAVFAAENEAVQAEIDNEVQRLREEVAQSVRRTMWAVILTAAVAVLLAVVLTWWTGRELVRPLLALRDTVRRQRHGERGAWARENAGAAEVRDLASDVNALTQTQRRFADAQAQSLTLLRVVASLTRQIQEAEDLTAAVQTAVREVGATLSVDYVTAMLVDAEGGRHEACWERARGLTTELGPLPEEGWLALVVLAERLWGGERRMIIDDLQQSGRPVPAWARAMPVFAETQGLLVLPVGVGRRAFGVMSVHLRAGPRTWEESEIAFVERTLRELARWAERQPPPASADPARS